MINSVPNESWLMGEGELAHDQVSSCIHLRHVEELLPQAWISQK